MYIILVYDISEKKSSTVMKICRKYLNHIQNSVFEGELSSANLIKLEKELTKAINKDTDSVIIYKLQNTKYTSRLTLGRENEISNFI